MKTIVENDTILSKYLLDDTEVVMLNEGNIVVGDPPKFVIADLNGSTVTVYENVNAPEDWIGNKYTFNGTDWALNSNWVEPTPAEPENAE